MTFALSLWRSKRDLRYSCGKIYGCQKTSLLVWHSSEAGLPIVIYRCNGKHGGNRNVKHHHACHTHMLNIEKAANGIYKEDDAHITTEYSTFSEAIYFFCEHCGIMEASKYFPTVYTINLFEV